MDEPFGLRLSVCSVPSEIPLSFLPSPTPLLPFTRYPPTTPHPRPPDHFRLPTPNPSPSTLHPDEFTVRGSTHSGGEIYAVFTRDETKIELKIKLPPTYPLCNVEVECAGKSGVKDARWRRWVLQIVQMLASQDGCVLDALLLWKRNLEREFEGVEPCPICYR